MREQEGMCGSVKEGAVEGRRKEETRAQGVRLPRLNLGFSCLDRKICNRQPTAFF